MTKRDRHLARRSAHVETMMRGETAEQVGAICFRTEAAGVIKVIIITARETGR